MKILAIGDQHLRLDLPYADYINDRREGEKRAVFGLIQEVAKKNDAVVLMGDGLHMRHNHSTVIKEFVMFIQSFAPTPVINLAGNHEVYNGTETAIDFLREAHLQHVTVVTSGPVRSDIGNNKVVFLPYCTNAVLGVDNYEDGSKEILRRIDEIIKGEQFDAIFLHHAISGIKTLGSMTDLFNEIVLPQEELEKRFKIVVGGHIHTPQHLGCTVVTGSIMTADAGEEEKYIWEVDLDKQTVGKIKLPVRPIHKVDIQTNEDVGRLRSFDSYAIVKCVVRSKDVNIESLREELKRFDAYVLVEDYPTERKKTHIDDGAMEDLSIENLLRLYAKNNKIEEKDLLTAYELIRK